VHWEQGVLKYVMQFLHMPADSSRYRLSPSQGLIPKLFLNPTIPATVAIIAIMTIDMISKDLLTVFSEHKPQN